MMWQGSDWQPTKDPCEVCSSTFNNGLHLKYDYVTCRHHSNCTSQVVILIRDLRKHNKKFSLKSFESMRLNSYDRDALIPFMSSELLIVQTRNTLVNCSRLDLPASTYDQALQLYAKEVVNRFAGSLHTLKQVDEVSPKASSD
jgi:hypothetical protein